MIEVQNLTKRYGDVIAVNDVSFVVEPGSVTGFLGPNGAGKSTTMRAILGLDRPDAGTVLVNGHDYESSIAPIAEVGALLEAKGFDKNRTARNHLLSIGATVGIGGGRVDEVLDLVGLSSVARSRAGGFSLGMGQRLGIAVALLADPRIVMLDEPVNGLDPDGVLWMRNLLRSLADEGRTVFLSSHLMSEMELIADHLIVIGRGRILADASMHSFIAESSSMRVRVRSPRLTELVDALRTVTDARTDVTDVAAAFRVVSDGELESEGLTASEIGEIAFDRGIVLHELTPMKASLEEAFMELTKDSVEFHTGEQA